MAVLDNLDFKASMIDYLEFKDETELANLVKNCDFIITDTGQFSYKIWNQTDVNINVRVPIAMMKPLTSRWKQLVAYITEVYPEDDEHALGHVRHSMKISKANKVGNEEQPGVSIAGGQVYDNLMAKVHKSTMDEIEKDYILEACNCGQRGLRLAAATMLGCAAEHLLLQLSRAYLSYLQKSGASAKEITNFEQNVVNAKKANARLDGFKRTVQKDEKLFESLGLENSNLHFTFFDFLRQIRNESGHPTGIKISSEDLSSTFTGYQLLIERVHPIITRLPTHTTE